jgi:hypothetical protein
MAERQFEQPRTARMADDPAGDDGLDTVRADADHLLQTADRVIQRALSQNSERFIHEVRQEGGQ